MRNSLKLNYILPVAAMPKGKGVNPIMDMRTTFFGVLKVGEVLESGCLVGIYEMVGHNLSGPTGFKPL